MRKTRVKKTVLKMRGVKVTKRKRGENDSSDLVDLTNMAAGDTLVGCRLVVRNKS